MIAKSRLGIHMAMKGGRTSVITNICEKRWKSIYEKAKAMPIARFQPMPPLFFLDDRATPIMVRMTADKGIAHLL